MKDKIMHQKLKSVSIFLIVLLFGCSDSRISRSENDLKSQIDDLSLMDTLTVELVSKLPNGFKLIDKNSQFYREGSMVYIRKTRGINDDIYEYVRLKIADDRVKKIDVTLWAIKLN